ncbi:MAG: helix-turn-helix transcriptional regulator [Polyangia bacterium]
MKKLEQRLRRALFMVPYLAMKGSAGALVSEAAAAIGTTPEELLRDVHRLSHVGVPDGDPGQYLTFCVHGSGANVRISAEVICRLKKPPRLTLQEALALLVGAAAVKKTRIAPYDEAIAGASKKLRDVLDRNSRSEADCGAHVVLRTASAEHRDTLTSLSRACRDHRAVKLDYASVAALKRREIRVHPYGLLNHSGVWYLLGKSLSHPENRIFVFRAERILGVTVLDETFTVPTDFNLREYMRDRMFITTAKPVEIVLRLREPAAARLRPWFKQQKCLRDGAVEVKFKDHATGYLAAWLLRQGEGVEVVAPVGLRKWVCGIAERVKEGHG